MMLRCEPILDGFLRACSMLMSRSRAGSGESREDSAEVDMTEVVPRVGGFVCMI